MYSRVDGRDADASDRSPTWGDGRSDPKPAVDRQARCAGADMHRMSRALPAITLDTFRVANFRIAGLSRWWAYPQLPEYFPAKHCATRVRRRSAGSSP